VTANLLNGKGEITDVELNCSYINEMVRKVTPFVEFENVHLSKVSFHVHSWANIRHSPIIIDIEHVKIVILEPMQYDPDASRRTKVRQLTFQELIQMMKEGLISKPRNQASSYNLLDRIFDNLVVEARSVSLTFQPMGIFKTRRVGPWTPPALLIQFFDVRWVNVNEYGHEESKNDISRHHRKHHHSRRKDGTLLVYKKLEMEYQISLVVVRSDDTMHAATANKTTDNDMNRLDSDLSEKDSKYKTVVPIISSSMDVTASGGPRTVHHHPYKKMEMQWTIKRRIRDGEYLAVQVDCMIPIIEIVLTDRSTLSHLIHFSTALQFCFYKDRSFTDPLRPTGVASPPPQTPTVVISNVEESSMTSSTEVVMVGNTDGKESESSSVLNLNLADGLSDSSDDDDDNSSAIDDDIEVDGTQQSQVLLDSSVHSIIPEEVGAPERVSQPSNRSRGSAQTRTPLVPNNAKLSSGRPLLVFSNGLVIHEKFSLSLSLHQIVISATHTKALDDTVEMTLRGVVAEAIWPPMTKVRSKSLIHRESACCMYCSYLLLSLRLCVCLRKKADAFKLPSPTCQYKNAWVNASVFYWLEV
jgi:N-terminal region of Chorein or VPS13